MEFIDKVVGIIFLPLSFLLFLNVFGVTNVQKLLGMQILFIAAVGLILIQVANIMSSHIAGEHVVLSYILHIPMIFPSIIYFISMGMTLSQNIMLSLPIIFASFIFVEGMYSFFF